jgi:hypothetical protein
MSRFSREEVLKNLSCEGKESSDDEMNTDDDLSANESEIEGDEETNKYMDHGYDVSGKFVNGVNLQELEAIEQRLQSTAGDNLYDMQPSEILHACSFLEKNVSAYERDLNVEEQSSSSSDSEQNPDLNPANSTSTNIPRSNTFTIDNREEPESVNDGRKRRGRPPKNPQNTVTSSLTVTRNTSNNVHASNTTTKKTRRKKNPSKKSSLPDGPVLKRIYGKDGTMWHKDPPSQSFLPPPQFEAEFLPSTENLINIEQFFNFFIDDFIVNKIVRYTKKK